MREEVLKMRKFEQLNNEKITPDFLSLANLNPYLICARITGNLLKLLVSEIVLYENIMSPLIGVWLTT